MIQVYSRALKKIFLERNVKMLRKITKNKDKQYWDFPGFSQRRILRIGGGFEICARAEKKIMRPIFSYFPY